MAWMYLIMAAFFEIGWPLGFKLAQNTSNQVFWIIFSTIFMALSGYFLYLAQKEIPIGIAYAFWTGFGAAGTFLIGISFFHDLSSLTSWLGLILIIAGVTLLRFSQT